jgi:hypothetical protein
MTLNPDSTHPEGIGPADGKTQIRCFECGTRKKGGNPNWLIDSGIIKCPSCRERYHE